MIDISRKGIFTVLPPYLLPSVEHEVIAVQSITAMISLGLDPFKLVYQPAGITEEMYRTISRSTQICLLKSVNGLRYIPRDAIVNEDTSSYVNYTNKAMVIHLGGHPQGTQFTNLSRSVAETVVSGTGVSPIIEVRDVTQPTQIPTQQHLEIQLDRQSRINLSHPLDTSQARESEIRLLTARIRALEQFLIQCSTQCTTGHGCTPGASLYTEQTVFYQYTLGDYYVQNSRGDLHDLPINNAFVDRLHDLNTTDSIHLS